MKELKVECGERQTILIFAKVTKLNEGEVEWFEVGHRRHCAGEKEGGRMWARERAGERGREISEVRHFGKASTANDGERVGEKTNLKS